MQTVSNFTFHYTLQTSVEFGLNIIEFQDPAVYAKGSFVLVEMINTTQMLLAVNTSNSSVSDYGFATVARSGYRLNPINATSNWRLCLKILITRSYFLSAYSIRYSPSQKGVYNFGIYLNSSLSNSLIFWSQYRLVGK